MQVRLIIAGLMSLVLSSVIFAETAKRVPSLNQVPAVIKSKDGLDQYREQMSGVAKPDGFGTLLPGGLTAKDIAALIAPGQDVSLATLIGAKAWPYRANSFVVIACFARTNKEYDDDKRNSKEPSCSKYYDPSRDNGRGYFDKPVYLGVLEYKLGDKPTLISSYGKPLDTKTGWKSSKLEGPRGKFNAPSSEESDLMPEEYMRFDFAPYKITEADTAIGLRLGWNEGYSGGTGYFEALSLFRIDGNRLINILSEPIYYYQDLAGSWNKDGTRNHEFLESQNVLSVLPSKTEGFYDLQIRTLKSKWKQVFVWDSKTSRYIAIASRAGTKKH